MMKSNKASWRNKLITVCVVISALGAMPCNGQSFSIQADSTSPPYPRIESVSVSKPHFVGQEGSVNRAIVTRQELRDHLFIERLRVNPEGTAQEVVCVARVTPTLFRKLGTHPEQRTFEKVEWANRNTLEVRVDSRIYRLKGQFCKEKIQVELSSGN